MKLLIVSKSFVVKSALEMYFKSSDKVSTILCKSDLYELKHEDLIGGNFIFIEINERVTLTDVVKLKETYNDIKIMVFDNEKKIDTLNEALKNGIEGYITNLNDEEEFNVIVKKIILGGRYYDIDLLIKYAIINNNMNNKSFKKCLTEREKEILKLVSSGCTNKKISEELYLSENTIKKHITNILNKLELHNRKELILYYKDEIDVSITTTGCKK